MVERRKTARENVKSVSIKGNKVSKIILYKKIALPVLAFIGGFLYLGYNTTIKLLEIQKIQNQKKEILKKVADIKRKQLFLIKQNKNLKKKIEETKIGYIDKEKLKYFLEKLTSILKVQHLVSQIEIASITNDPVYKNMVDVELIVHPNSKYLNPEIIKDILTLLLKDILYIKDISSMGNNIKLKIYQKV